MTNNVSPCRTVPASITVDGANGNNGQASRFGLPYKTLAAASAAALAGDTILVLPGTYNEHDIAKHLVNWHFLPGATVTWTDSGTAPTSIAIFDDHSTAMTFRVTGLGNFTTVLTGAFAGFSLIVALNHASSDVAFACDIASTTGGFSQVHSGFSIRNCAKFVLDFNQLLDPNYGTGTSYNVGVYWEKGLTYIRGKLAKMDSSVIWANEPAGSPGTDLYADIQHIESYWFATLYLSTTGAGTGYRMWVTSNQIIGGALGFPTLVAQTGGKMYVTAQKISSSGAFSVVSVATGTLVWINCQKMTSGNNWITAAAGFTGKLHVSNLEYEDNGGIAIGFNIAGTGTVTLHGGVAKVLNGIGLLATGGTIRCKGLVIDTTNTNAVGNVPVKLNVNTVMLDNCTLLAPAAANAVTTVAAAQTFKNYGTKGTTALNVNATVLGGDIYAADANVT